MNQVLAPVDWERASVIVEYGPGVGTLTAEILRRMRPDARLVVIEDSGHTGSDAMRRAVRDAIARFAPT